MVRVELDRWGQRLQDLCQTALHADHPRTRERFQALYLIASGQFNATTCADTSAAATRPSWAGSTATTPTAPTPWPTAAPAVAPPF